MENHISETNTWEELNLDPSMSPAPRSGHCSVALNHRAYIWSGRDGYKKFNDLQVCFRDLWFLETGIRRTSYVVVYVFFNFENIFSFEILSESCLTTDVSITLNRYRSGHGNIGVNLLSHSSNVVLYLNQILIDFSVPYSVIITAC